MTYIGRDGVRFEWDEKKDQGNRVKHGLSFDQASHLFTGDDNYLEIYDEEHSDEEDRFIAIGRIDRGVVVVVYVEREERVIRIVSARLATARERRLLEAYWRERRG